MKTKRLSNITPLDAGPANRNADPGLRPETIGKEILESAGYPSEEGGIGIAGERTPRQRRTPASRKKAFLRAYEDSGSETESARLAGIERATHYKWLAADKKYNAAFEAAKPIAAGALQDNAIRLATVGFFEPVIYKGQFQYAPRKRTLCLLVDGTSVFEDELPKGASVSGRRSLAPQTAFERGTGWLTASIDWRGVQNPGIGVPRQFGPVVDGDSLPADPFDPIAPAQSAGVPLLIGATTEEVTSMLGFADPTIYTIGDDDLIVRLSGYCGCSTAVAEQVAATYRAARQGETAARLFAQIASDWRFGYASTVQAERQSAQAPVYVYRLAWQSPVQGGRMGAAHNLCMPLVFGRDKAPGVTGDGTAHHALAAAVQTAWATFARSGDPNHAGLPDWPRYDASDRRTMRLDTECRVERDPGAAERIAQATLPPRA